MVKVEAQDGNAVLVGRLGIDFAVVVLAGDAFAPPGKADDRPVEPAIILFELLTVAASALTVRTRQLVVEILDAAAEAERDAAPVVGAPAQHAGPKPSPVGVAGGGVRLPVNGPPAETGVKLPEGTGFRGCPAASIQWILLFLRIFVPRC